MIRNKFTWVVYAVIGLAVFGIVSQAFTNPANIFKSLIIMAVIGLLIFGAVNFIFLRNRKASNQMKKYKMAVKQSKIKYNNNKPNENSSNKSTNSYKSRKKLNRRASHLRVIDGTKPKEKSRTIF